MQEHVEKARDPGASGNTRKDILLWLWCGLVMLFFLILKSFSLHWGIGDGNIYLSMAWAIGHYGVLPYRDFFFAHPPLHLLPGVVLLKFLDVTPLTAGLLPIGASLIGALFLFLIAKRHFGSLAAAVTLLSYCFAYDLLRASSHWTGINLSVLWMILGMWALLKNRPALSGAFLAIGVCTGTYVLPAALMGLALAVLQSGHSGKRFTVGFAIPWGTVQVSGFLLGGGAYWNEVYRYHVAKPGTPAAVREMFIRVIGDNFPIFLGTFFGTVLLFLDPILDRAGWNRNRGITLWSSFRESLFSDGPRGIARLAALWTLGMLLFIAMLRKVFPFYFLLAFPSMALLTGYAVDRIWHHTLSLWRGRTRQDRHWKKARRLFSFLLMAVIVALLIRTPLHRKLLPDYFRSQNRPMQWADAPIPQFLNSALHSCCFENPARAGKDYGTVQELLYHESQYFEKAEDLAAFVREQSSPTQTIFGDSGTTGLIALLAQRRVAADEADTNVMRFKSGITDPEDLIRRIDTPDLAFVLVEGTRTKEGGIRYNAFGSNPTFRHWLDGNFEVAFETRDRTKGTFFLLKKKSWMSEENV